MKSFRMKALAVAVLGLAGVGSAVAACPTISNHTGNATPGGGGAWTSQTVGGGGFMDIITPGLAGTNCALAVNIGTSPVSNVKALVSDTSPQNEPRYRARFYFNISALTLTAANFQAEMFNAFANTAPGTFNTDEVKIFLIGGGSPALRFKVADATQSSGFKTITAPLPSATTPGHYYVEFDLTSGAGSGAVSGVTCNACTAGAAGCFRYWVTAEGTASSDSSPTGTCSLSNAGWSGVKQANLGLYGTTALFRANNASAAANLVIDEFDSRRQTFIGQ
jgi:hypothetical protein